MGPRSIDRGTESRHGVVEAAYALQWGRDQLIAELSSGLGNNGDMYLLQWGRDQLIAGLTFGRTG